MKHINWILVPIDFSEESRLALEVADRQTSLWGSGLILLHVQKQTERSHTRLSIESAALERWAEKVHYTPSQRVSVMTCQGDPIEKIIQIASQYQPRKIVMGRGGDARQPGSVAQAVGRGFPGLVQVISKRREDIYLHAGVA